MPVFGPMYRAMHDAFHRSITQAGAGGGGAFDPASLFGASEPGFAYDLSTAGLSFQDLARTTLVAANGDPIASPTDLSGNGKHGELSTAGTRPLFQGYADFDGSNDYLATPAIDFTGTGKVTVIVGMRRDADDALRLVLEMSDNVNSNAAFALFTPDGANTAFYMISQAGGVYSDARFLDATAAPSRSVISGFIDTSLATNEVAYLRQDGVAQALTRLNNGNISGTFGNHRIYIGARGGSTFPMLGRIYRIIVIGRELTAGELADAEAWCEAPFI